MSGPEGGQREGAPGSWEEDAARAVVFHSIFLLAVAFPCCRSKKTQEFCRKPISAGAYTELRDFNLSCPHSLCSSRLDPSLKE